MDEFSLEHIAEKIHYGKTKDYFFEVLSSYQNGNYRSTVVMLWSVAVCDIVYKLQNLVDLYDDNSAKEILNEVTKIQEDDEKSSTWEIKLVEEVYAKTNLLDSAECENLRYLQKQRHLSAHPILNSDRELHSPNKETVRSLIRNTLEGLLIKPPFYTQKIIDELLEDLAESKAALNTRKKIKQYVESRYFSRTTPSVELNIFRSLWKLVFKLENEQCSENRYINLRTLEVLAIRNSGSLVGFVNGDKDYFSNIAAEGEPVAYLVYFLANNSVIFESLNEDAKLKVRHCIETHEVGKTLGWFVKPDLATHANDLKNWIESDERPKFTPDQFDSVLEISDTDEWQSEFCKLTTSYYTVSRSFDQADSRFQVAIPKYIDLYDKEALIDLAAKIEDNGQCWARGRARQDYEIIKDRIDELFGDNFEYDECPNFRRIVVVAD